MALPWRCHTWQLVTTVELKVSTSHPLLLDHHLHPHLMALAHRAFCHLVILPSLMLDSWFLLVVIAEQLAVVVVIMHRLCLLIETNNTMISPVMVLHTVQAITLVGFNMIPSGRYMTGENVSRSGRDRVATSIIIIIMVTTTTGIHHLTDSLSWYAVVLSFKSYVYNFAATVCNFI